MRSKTFLVLALLASFGGAARSQVLVFEQAAFSLFSEAQAGEDSDAVGGGGGIFDLSYTDSVEAYAEESGGETGYNYARGTASLNWSFTDSTFAGGVGGIAEAYSEGAETYAHGSANIGLFFTLTEDAVIDLQYDGTYESQIYRWNGDDYEQVYSVGAWEVFNLAAGQYRWNSSAGEAVSGTSYYSSGMYFTATVEAVPEPGTMLALAAGAGVLARRRRN